MISETIFRVFASFFLIGIEWAVYMALQLAWIRPAADIYIQKCNSDCVYPLSVQVTQVAYAVLAITVLLCIVYIVMPFTSRKTRPQKAKPELETPTEE